MADWDEIKRLAADFQRTQTSDTLQRISERNCIDIVKKLTELNLIELIYTCDGKEFITPSHLLKEIEDEIYVNGGRMHLHDLATNLNVDYQHVESKARDLARDKPDEYSVILGQVIHSTYKDTLAKQINDCMLINGQLSIAEFAKSLDLPSEFLLTIVKELMPKVMDDFVVSQDQRTYYTSNMMDRYRSIIAGTLSAISKPTTIASLLKRLDIPERIFQPIVDNLIKDGRIDATVENRLFIPSVHAREQNEWISKFYSSNSYIEYDVLSRMDIKQPKAFLKKRFPEGISLKTCLVSPNLVSQVESMIEDCIASNGWIDVSTIVPSAIESDDIEQLLQDILKKNKQFNSSCLILNQTNVCSLGYVALCKSSFDNLMKDKAQEHLKQGKLMLHFLGCELKSPSRKEVDSNEKSESKEPNPENQEYKRDDNEDSGNQDKSTSQNIDEDTNPGGKGSKKDRKERKGKTELLEQDEDSDEDHGKKSKSRKSGGGTQGREIKQKSVKKKYIPGNKGNQKNNDQSDEESTIAKAPRSNKGRLARRGVSPDRSVIMTKSKVSQPSNPQKEHLVFMRAEEIITKLKGDSKRSDECPDELFESIAEMIEDSLNTNYLTVAKQTLDDYMKRQEDEDVDQTNAEEVDLIE